MQDIVPGTDKAMHRMRDVRRAWAATPSGWAVRELQGRCHMEVLNPL